MDKYKFVSGYANSDERLERQVNELAAKGWMIHSTIVNGSSMNILTVIMVMTMDDEERLKK